jgi:hypothetical protein
MDTVQDFAIAAVIAWGLILWARMEQRRLDRKAREERSEF